MKKFVCGFVVFAIVAAMFACASGGRIGNREQGTGELEVAVFPQLGHSGQVTSVAFSPDGKMILSGSFDQTIKLWDAATGREIRTFNGHLSTVQAVAFSPDGKQIISGSYDSTIKLWDIVTGTEIKTFLGHTAGVFSVAFSPDGKQIISGSESNQNNLKLWDVDSGQEIRTFSGHIYGVYSAKFSTDGKHIISGSQDNNIILWDVASGEKIREFSGHTNRVNSVSFSLDGKKILSGSYDGSIKLWEVTSGQVINTFIGNLGSVSLVSFSPDEKFILFCSMSSVFRLLDAMDGQVINTFRGRGGAGSGCFSPDGKQILTANQRAIVLWDVTSFDEIKYFSGNISSVNSISISSDGKYIISGSDDNAIKLWDITNGYIIRLFLGHKKRILSVCFSPNNKYIISGSGGTLNSPHDNVVKLWDIETGLEIKSFLEHQSSVTSVSFSPNGKYIISGSGSFNDSPDNIIKLWDKETGLKIKSFSGHKGYIHTVSFSPDGKQVLSGSSDGTMKLWNVETGEEIKTFFWNNNIITSASFSSDGKQVISSSANYSREPIRLWDVASEEVIRILPYYGQGVSRVSINSSGNNVLSGSSNGIIKLWDVANGLELETFTGHSGSVSSVFFTPCGTRIISGSTDGTVRLWDIATGKEIASFISFTDNEWIVITPDGYYNASPNGDQYLNVRVGNNVYGIDQYHEIFYRPDIVEARLEGDTSTGEKITIQDITTRVPPTVNITSPANNTTVQTATANLRLTIEDRNQPIRQVKVFINGRSVGSEEMRSISARRDIAIQETSITVSGRQKNVNLDLPLRLEPGRNVIEVQAYNGYSWSRRTSVTINNESSQQAALPNLWILAIGVNRYDNQTIRDLNYCVRDAQELVNTFKQQEGVRYAKVNSLLIADGSPVPPTASNIKRNMNFFSGVSPGDVVILFLAGHGVSDASGNFIFLPSDAAFDSRGNPLAARTLSSAEILAAMNLPCHGLVIIDACHSGGVSNRTQAVNSNHLIRVLMQSNAYIFTASLGTEPSIEMGGDIRHGVFTYYLLQGLRGNAAPTDNTVTMKQLDAYVTKEVMQFTGNRQTPNGSGLGFVDIMLVKTK